MIFLGVDIGTTRVKTVAYAVEEREVVADASTATPVRTTADGAVHDPLAVFHVVLQCVRAVVADCAALGRVGEVAAICAVSLAEEVVLVSASGEPVTESPVWYEPRGARYVPAFAEYRGAATATNPAFSLFTLRWISEHLPDAWSETARFTDIGSFVLCRLAGRGTDLVMDHSHASRTGAFDPVTRKFNDDLLAWAGDWADSAPRPVPSGTVIGTLAATFAHDLGLPVGVQVVSGAHDHFAAAFACGVRAPGDAMLSTGTAEALLVLTDALPLTSGLPVDVGCFVDDTTFYAHRGFAAGAVFASWRRLLSADGPLRTAWFTPPGGPARRQRPLCRIDPEFGTVSFSDLPLTLDTDDVLRCLSEGLAMSARTSLDLLERVAGPPVRRVVVAGTAANHPSWQRMRAEVLQRDLRVVSTPEPSALGAAVLAQHALTGVADTPVQGRDLPAIEPNGYYRDLLSAYGHGVSDHGADDTARRTATEEES